MKKKLLCLTIFFIITCAAIAQEQCGTKAPSEAWEQWFQTKITERKADLASGRLQQTNYVIPVIVHIIHDGDEIGQGENISSEQVKSQIDILNADFGGTGYGTNNYPAPSEWPSIANTGISFCLAAIDYNGKTLDEPGIDRINWQNKGWLNPSSFNSASSLIDYFNNTIKPRSFWNQYQYLNIWICKFNNTFSLNGFAPFPELSGLTDLPQTSQDLYGEAIETDTTSGLVIRHDAFGNIGTALNSGIEGRTAVHEAGHYLGLWHIWGDDECGDDYVCDTPTQDSSNRECPNYPHFSQCNNNLCSGNINSHGDMFMNFMDYTQGQCKYMFTPGQSERIQTTMINGTFRKSLINSPACQSTIKPDLIVIAPQVTPIIVNAGSDVLLSFAEDNQGDANAAANYVSFHISKDAVLTPGANGDRWIGEYHVNQTLFPRSQTILLYKTVTIPTDLTPGTYYIFFSADGSEVINEYTEDNNFASVQITITNSSTNCSNANFAITPSTNWLTHSNSHGVNDSKTYRVPVVSGNVYTFKTGCGNGATANYDTYLELFKSNCASIKANDDSCESTRSAISLTANFTGDAYLKVNGYGGRGGNYTLAYQYHTCVGWYTSPSTKSFTSAAGSGSFTTYTTIGGCAFTTVNNNPSWIKNITYTGSGAMNYTVDANYGPARSGTISIKDVNNVVQATYTIYQDEGTICRTCPSYDLTLTPATYWQTITNSHITDGCKIYRIYVNLGSIYTFKTGCDDGATANYDTYLELLNNGCSTITYDDDECESQRSSITWKATYSGYIYLKVRGFGGAGGNYTLAYNYNICSNWAANPISNSFSSTRNSGSFVVSISSSNVTGCYFTASSNNSWINNLTFPGNGTVEYNVDFNPDAARTGTISIKVDGVTLLTHTVYQDAGSTCTSCPSFDVSITPTTNWQTHTSSHGINGCKLYRIPVTTGKIYTFKTGCDDGATADYDTYLSLYNNNCTNIAVDDDGCAPGSVITWPATYNGYVYLKVLGYNNSSGTYTLAYNYISCSNPAQPFTISGSNLVCQNSTQTYSVTPVSGATNYIWNLPSGWSGNSTSNSITVTTGNSGGTISVYTSNDCGNSATKTLSINITPIPSKPGNIIGNSFSVCQGSSQTYSIEPVSGATSYTWYLPPGWIGNSSLTSINSTIGNSSGIIYVTANNICGSSNEQLIDILVTKIPSIQGIISGLTQIDQESSETYSINDIPDATGYNWTWPLGWFENYGQGTNFINVKAGSNSGQICVNPTNLCGSGIPTCLSIGVNQTTHIIGPTSVTPGLNIDYIANSSNATSYIWTVPQGWIINSGQGTSTVNINIGSGFGEVCVTPIINGTNGIQTCISINIVTGIKNTTNLSTISIYPNPNTGDFILEIDLQKSGNCQINITNMLGQKVFEEIRFLSNSKNKIPIQLSNISSGAYNVNLIIDKENYSKQIIITK